MIKEIDLAYIAGFFDGEGCIHSGLRHRKRGQKDGNPGIRIMVGQRDPFILVYIRDCFRLGYIIRCNKGRTWRYHIGSAEEVYNFLENIIPYLKGKKAQAEIALDLSKRIMENRIGKEERKIRMKMMSEIKKLKRKKGEYNEKKK